MPRDLLRQLFEQQTAARKTQMYGRTLTKFVLTPYDPLGQLMPVADIEVSGMILSGVPLSANNRELLYTNAGTPVALTRSITGRVEVTGVSKRGGTATYMYMMTMPQLTPETSGGISALSPGSLISMGSIGFSTRRSTIGDLGTIGDGFGTVPLETSLLIDLEGAIIRVLG